MPAQHRLYPRPHHPCRSRKNKFRAILQFRALLKQQHVLGSAPKAIASAADPGALADKIVAGGLNVREAEALAAAPTARAERKPGAQKASNADTLALEQDLAEALGLEVALKDRGGKGEITVRYATLEQLDEICRRLMRGDRHAGV